MVKINDIVQKNRSKGIFYVVKEIYAMEGYYLISGWRIHKVKSGRLHEGEWVAFGRLKFLGALKNRNESLTGYTKIGRW